ncbi:hypothetical protein Aduo_001373 [Ancylostoma duodenale]
MRSPNFWLLLILVLDLNLFIEARKPTKGYDTSFVYLSARNVDSGEEVKVCANYLHLEFSVSLQVQKVRIPGSAVPLLYRIEDDGTECTLRFSERSPAFKNATQYQLDQLKRYGAENAILLVEKGKKFMRKRHDYLFSDFYDPYVNASNAIGTFFLYTHVFHKEILGLVKGSDVSPLQLRFHRPHPYPIDLSMAVMRLLAVGCVTGGGTWAFVRRRFYNYKAGKDKLMSFYTNFRSIAFLVVIVVGILIIGIFIRPILVASYYGWLVVLGSLSVYGCTIGVFILRRDATVASSAPLASEGKTECSAVGCIHVITRTLLNMVCIPKNTFILLDFINVTLCLHTLKSVRLSNVKWVTVLMVCMFVYDVVMVFVTPHE